MHELGITRNIVEIVCEHAEGARIGRVRIQIGRLSAIMPDAVRFCFQEVRRGTLAEEAELEIDEVPGRAACLDCGAEFEMPVTGARCHCGSAHYRLVGGNELKIVEMDLL